MYSLIFIRGLHVESLGVGGISAGVREFDIADAGGFERGRPTFLVESDGSGVQALGRLEEATPGHLRTQWKAVTAPAAGWRVRQAAEYIVIGPHTFPLLHREYRTGLEDVATEGGVHRTAATREPELILRLRVQRPDTELLEQFLTWGQLLSAAGDAEFNFVDFGREFRRVALASESIEIEPEHWRAEEPFDILMRVAGSNDWVE